MKFKSLVFPLLLIALAAVPVLLARGRESNSNALRRVIIYTPHNEQIRSEFARGFAEWHLRKFGEDAEVIWNTPGGTSEIRRILDANAQAALRENRPIGGNADLVFGGGSYEYGQLKLEIRVGDGADARSGRILQAPSFDDAYLTEIYGANTIGDNTLYDIDHYWFGVALSGFGIVYNRDILKDLGVPEPRIWADLTDARLAGSVTLVNPAQSGSVTTALEAIIQRLGWEQGWQIIRRMSANARSVASSAPKVPLDVSAGDSAAGPCIDFYGRYQAQAIATAGDPDRLGYVDPLGQTVIDPDPVALLSNAPNRETAERFIRFALSDDGQALWQFRVNAQVGALNGPVEFELRRMPVRRDFIAKYHSQFMDDVDPFTLASAVKDPDKNARSYIAPLFSAMCADRRDELASAWKAIYTHPKYPHEIIFVTAANVDDAELKSMLLAFDAMPIVTGPENVRYEMSTREGRASIKEGYLKGKWKSANLWPEGATPIDELRRHFGSFFHEQYSRIMHTREAA